MIMNRDDEIINHFIDMVDLHMMFEVRYEKCDIYGERKRQFFRVNANFVRMIIVLMFIFLNSLQIICN